MLEERFIYREKMWKVLLCNASVPDFLMLPAFRPVEVCFLFPLFLSHLARAFAKCSVIHSQLFGQM